MRVENPEVMWHNEDSFDRLSEAKERRSYQRLNEPVALRQNIPLPFAFLSFGTWALTEGKPFA